MARFRLVGEGPDDVAVFVALIKRYGLPLSEKGKEAPDKLVIECPGGDAAVLRALRTIVVAWLCRLYGLASPRLTTP
jgi:hypothetical protein